MANPALIAKAAAALLSNENTRKGVGWAVAAMLSPVIVAAALLCILVSGVAGYSSSTVQLCFGTEDIPASIPAEYRVCIEEMRTHLAELDIALWAIDTMVEGADDRLDPVRVKAVFYSLYFGVQAPDVWQFADCFVTYETRTRTATEVDGAGNIIQMEQPYVAAIPVADMDTVYEHIALSLGVEATQEQKSDAESVYSLITDGGTEMK